MDNDWPKNDSDFSIKADAPKNIRDSKMNDINPAIMLLSQNGKT